MLHDSWEITISEILKIPSRKNQTIPNSISIMDKKRIHLLQIAFRKLKTKYPMIYSTNWYIKINFQLFKDTGLSVNVSNFSRLLLLIIIYFCNYNLFFLHIITTNVFIIRNYKIETFSKRNKNYLHFAHIFKYFIYFSII